MKKIVFIVFGLFAILTIIALLSEGNWHLKRNRNNKLPTGELTKTDGNNYVDEAKLNWILQPNSRNIFHQPDNIPVQSPSTAYPNVSPQLKYEPNYPNLKFLSPNENGGSYEAILQPDGTYLITGKKQGTFNYSDPTGFFGFSKHIIMDVIPHFFSFDYDDSLNVVKISKKIQKD